MLMVVRSILPLMFYCSCTESFDDMRESDLVRKAEKKYRTHLTAMRDAYGDEDGYHIFKLVVRAPQKYQCDNRRLIQTLVYLLFTSIITG